MSELAVVIIGRNEGDRLVASLASVAKTGARIVYVDSGSTDGSIAAARDVGAQVVELDLSVPFTAARARNEGFAALDPKPEYVQFIDGDCMIVDGWLDRARAFLEANDDAGIVTGWRSEIHPDASVFNGMAEVEWHRPAGDILGCGGDMMVRTEVFQETEGFNPRIIAAEDEEFCTRVRKAGWRVHRLPEDMTRHDADMMHARQWWQRAVRTGHGFAQVGALHPEYFARDRQRVWVYAVILPLIALAGLMFWPWLLIGVLGLYALSYVRTVRGLTANGLPQDKALHQSIYLSLSKFPNLLGIITYHWRVLRHRDMAIIEYK